LLGSNSGQVVHTHVPLSPSSIIWYRPRAVMFCGWEGNRRSGVALVMRHRLSGLSTYRLKGQRAGDEHPPTLHWSTVPPLPFFTSSRLMHLLPFTCTTLCIARHMLNAVSCPSVCCMPVLCCNG